MKAIILTETGPKIGFGHLSRCISLAYALKEQEIDTHFVISGEIDAKFQDLNEYSIEQINWVQFPNKLEHILDSYDIIILDSYNAQAKIYKLIDQSNGFPVFIDDTNETIYPRGIVINSSAAASSMNYPQIPHVQYLMGPHFSMLKPVFWKKETREVKFNPENVLIAIGAADLQNITPKIVKNLVAFNPNFKISIIVTSYYNNIDEINKQSSVGNCEVIYSPNTLLMRKLMSKTDFAVAAGGQTSYELASMMVPSIVIVTAFNQIFNAEYMAKNRIILFAGSWYDSKLWTKFNNELAHIQQSTIRQELSHNASNFIKADGSKTIVKILLDNVYKEKH